MSFKTTIHKLAGAALAAATLLAVAPMGAANAEGDGAISVPTAIAGSYTGETITIQGDKSMLEGHQFKAVRIGTYANVKGTANGDGTTGVLNAVSVGTDPQITAEATTALREVKGGDADVHYQGNPVGEVAAKWLGFSGQANDDTTNDDTTSNNGGLGHAWDGKLRQFVSNVFYSAKFGTLLGAAAAQPTDSSAATVAGDKMTVSISGLLPGIYMVDDVTGEAGAAGMTGKSGSAAAAKAAGNSIPMLVSTAITSDGVAYNKIGASNETLGVVDMKNDAPTVDKALDTDKINNASIGGEMHYKLTGSVPLTTGFRRYIYTMVDRPAQLGLHFVSGSEKVMVGTTQLSAANGDYKVTAHAAAGGQFKDIPGDDSTDYVVFDLSPSILKFRYRDSIVITYTMSITDDADGGQLQNGATLSYSSDVNNQPSAANSGDPTVATIDPASGNVVSDGTGNGSLASNATSPENPASVASFRKFSVVTKPKLAWDNAKDEAARDAIGGLTGVKYQLFAADAKPSGAKAGEGSAMADALKFIKLGDGHYKLVAAQNASNNAFVSDLEVGSDGKLTFDGLGKGDYSVRELTRPAGYSDTFMPVFKVHVEADAANAAKSIYTNESDSWNLVAPHATAVSSDKPIVVLAITSISQLPLTGGAGIVLALLVIVLLAVATGTLIMVRRRLRQE
ncbi:isopeptide-forming domain-containing fimbrial protein [Bifidobacterium sp. ESL0769]|uniref:isopeptide-forming domain-containing fimbrial protein n=1 Tax=Bifidobacterium sp. ESL0769 TaxID=2983229 RepID=UPI0023F6D6AE|nr:isopeptide-forming domain-containing fimbrial protein [Bifidobacterium sp. ESL0769]WEV67272.1 isopeptide-forming domain-containing fimbrial protein [Bifidobacterium sp. ESL0769]